MRNIEWEPMRCKYHADCSAHHVPAVAVAAAHLI